VERLLAHANGPGDKATRDRRCVIKGPRWLLLKNGGTRRLTAVACNCESYSLHANRARFIAYVLMDDLKQMWRFRYPAAVRRCWPTLVPTCVHEPRTSTHRPCQ